MNYEELSQEMQDVVVFVAKNLDLEDYLNNTPPEQLKKDFEELEKYNQYGPTIDECLDLGEKHCREIMEQMHKESNNKK